MPQRCFLVSSWSDTTAINDFLAKATLAQVERVIPGEPTQSSFSQVPPFFVVIDCEELPNDLLPAFEKGGIDALARALYEEHAEAAGGGSPWASLQEQVWERWRKCAERVSRLFLKHARETDPA